MAIYEMEIPLGTIEESIVASYKLRGPVVVVGAEFDETAEVLAIVLEVDQDDFYVLSDPAEWNQVIHEEVFEEVIDGLSTV